MESLLYNRLYNTWLFVALFDLVTIGVWIYVDHYFLIERSLNLLYIILGVDVVFNLLITYIIMKKYKKDAVANL